jgi:hypothetical protein
MIVHKVVGNGMLITNGIVVPVYSMVLG